MPRCSTTGRAAALERLATLTGRPVEPSELYAEQGRASAADKTVPLAIYAAARLADDFETAVTFAIRCGGDTDTGGAMCGAIAGARHGQSSIPARWLDALEDGGRGRAHVERLATALGRRALTMGENG